MMLGRNNALEKTCKAFNRAQTPIAELSLPQQHSADLKNAALLISCKMIQ
jgi:hypothetical protein